MLNDFAEGYSRQMDHTSHVCDACLPDAISKESIARAFGFHLMLDCYGCSAEKLDDVTACYDFLDTLVEKIGACKQSQPYVFRTPSSFKGKEGLSGWVPIVESGISIHTLTGKQFVSIDVYSCKVFDCTAIIDFTKDFFMSDRIEKNYILRGKDYH